MFKLKITTVLILLISVVTLNSCAPKVSGAWSISRYETKDNNNQSVSFTNIGTINVDKNGSGYKNISYFLLGTNITDNEPFTWSLNQDKDVMTINSYGSQFSKAWIMLQSSKSHQLWKSTDGGIGVQTLELEKVKTK